MNCLIYNLRMIILALIMLMMFNNKHQLASWPLTLCTLGNKLFMIVLSSADFLQNQLFQNILSATLSESRSWSGSKHFAKLISRRLPLHSGEYFMDLLSSAERFQAKTLRNATRLSKSLIPDQDVSVLIWDQTICISYQLTIKVKR